MATGIEVEDILKACTPYTANVVVNNRVLNRMLEHTSFENTNRLLRHKRGIATVSTSLKQLRNIFNGEHRQIINIYAAKTSEKIKAHTTILSFSTPPQPGISQRCPVV